MGLCLILRILRGREEERKGGREGRKGEDEKHQTSPFTESTFLSDLDYCTT